MSCIRSRSCTVFSIIIRVFIIKSYLFMNGLIYDGFATTVPTYQVPAYNWEIWIMNFRLEFVLIYWLKKCSKDKVLITYVLYVCMFAFTHRYILYLPKYEARNFMCNRSDYPGAMLCVFFNLYLINTYKGIGFLYIRV